MAPTFLIALTKLFFISLPKIFTLPLVIDCNPNNNLIVVVLPAPLGPINPNISPSNSLNDTSLTIT